MPSLPFFYHYTASIFKCNTKRPSFFGSESNFIGSEAGTTSGEHQSDAEFVIDVVL